MSAFIGIGVDPDEPGNMPRVVFQASAIPLTAPSTQTQNDGPTQPPSRVRRVKIIQWAPPCMIVEATPSAALDIQDLAGIKQIEPNPSDSEPDHTGSLYYTLTISLLYDFSAIVAHIEALNHREPVLEAFQVCEM